MFMYLHKKITLVYMEKGGGSMGFKKGLRNSLTVPYLYHFILIYALSLDFPTPPLPSVSSGHALMVGGKFNFHTSAVINKNAILPFYNKCLGKCVK